MGGESINLSDCFGESEEWDNVHFSGAPSADDIFSILEALEESNEGFGFQTSSSTFSSLPSAFREDSEAETELAGAAFSQKMKRQKMNPGSEIQVEEGQQRTAHITVERNRRKQMNEHLAVLRSLMPCFHVRRGDQASIIGGVVDYINELKQVLLSLEAKKQRRHYNELVLSPRPSPISQRMPPLSPRLGLPISPTTPQPCSPYKSNILRNQQACYLNLSSLPSPVDRSPCNSSTSSINDSVNELVASSKSAVAEVEVKFSGSNLLLNTVSHRAPRQVLNIISALEELALEILKVSISPVDETIVLKSFTIKIGIGCQLSAEELAHQIQQTFS